MRIISKFHDYYDSAQRYGRDNRLVYVRQQQEMPVRESKPEGAALAAFVELALQMAPTPWEQELYGDPVSRRVEVVYGLLVFAGKLYPYARVTLYRVASGTASVVVHTAEAYEAVMAPLSLGGAQGIESAWQAGRKKAFWQLRDDSRLHALCLQDAVACVSFERNKRSWKDQGQLRVNPRLADLEFFKVKDPWQAYQELSMFHGNVAAPDRTPVNVSDKDRIVQHGFDKWSFRKRPPA